MAKMLTSSPKEITTIWNKNFICVMVLNTLMCFGHFASHPLVASYTKYLGTSEELTGLLAGIFYGIAFAMRPVTGPMMTKLDKRLLIILTFACGCVANIGYAMFDNITAFTIFRVLHGLQFGFQGSLVMTLASDNLPLERMTTGMGLYAIGTAVATAIAPTLGTALLGLGTRTRSEGFGFVLVFVFAAFSLALAIIPATLLSPDRKTKEEVAGTGAWYKNIITVHALPAAANLFMIQGVYSLYTVYIIEYGIGRGIGNISVFFMVFATALAVSRPLSGALTDRLGTKKIFIPGIGVFALSLITVSLSNTLWMVLIGAALGAVGLGATQPQLMTMGVQTVHPIKRGVASNTIYMGIDLGLFLGPLLGGLAIARVGYVSMYRIAVIPLALALIGFLATFPLFRRRRAELESEQ